MNPLIQGHSGSSPETSRNALGTKQGANEDDSESNPHPEASVCQSQATRNSGPDDSYDNHQAIFLCYGFSTGNSSQITIQLQCLGKVAREVFEEVHGDHVAPFLDIYLSGTILEEKQTCFFPTMLASWHNEMQSVSPSRQNLSGIYKKRRIQKGTILFETQQLQFKKYHCYICLCNAKLEI